MMAKVSVYINGVISSTDGKVELDILPDPKHVLLCIKEHPDDPYTSAKVDPNELIDLINKMRPHMNVAAQTCCNCGCTL